MADTNANRCWCGKWHKFSFTKRGKLHVSRQAAERFNKEEGNG